MSRHSEWRIPLQWRLPHEDYEDMWTTHQPEHIRLEDYLYEQSAIDYSVVMRYPQEFRKRPHG